MFVVRRSGFGFIYLFALLAILCRPAWAAAQGPEMMPAKMEGKDRVCLDCHRLPNIATNEGVLTSRALCLECHAKESVGKTIGKFKVPLQTGPEAFKRYPHGYAACIQCHTDISRSPHRSSKGPECRSCHPVHGEGALGDPHLRVSCQACHHTSKLVFLDKGQDRVRLARLDDKGQQVRLTNHALGDTQTDDSCLRCHFAKNPVGAPPTVLPKKGFICLVCHYAPLSLGHPLFWSAFLIFIAGWVFTFSFWFRGSVEGEEKSRHRKISLVSELLWDTLFSRKFGSLLKVMFFDVFFQRRLLQESVKRWFIHSLIYLSLLTRLAMGLFTLIAFKIAPESAAALALINKNHPFTGFSYDLLGALMLLGLILAACQRLVVRPAHVLSEGQDTLALTLLGSLVGVGFLLEGVRILVTQVSPEVAIYSFIGYSLSKGFAGLDLDWPALYTVLWYVHAVLGAALVAYLPFGKMKHVLVTPLNLMISQRVNNSSCVTNKNNKL